MPIAVHEDMLAGASPLDKLKQARDLGLDGVEFGMRNGADWIKQVADAVAQTGVQVSAIYLGHTRLLHPEYEERDAAIAAVRRAMGAAVDIGASGVILLPHYQPRPVLPDLHPYKSSQELEAELLVTQFRATLCDLAYAMGTTLYLLPVNSSETHLIRRVQHAAYIRSKLDRHPHLMVAANLYHVLCENESIETIFSEFREDLGYLYLCDGDRHLPSPDHPDAVRFLSGVQDALYNGWICLEHAQIDAASPQEIETQIISVIEWLRDAGIS
jgi:sugar phosphate isomerase/epimerase